MHGISVPTYFIRKNLEGAKRAKASLIWHGEASTELSVENQKKWAGYLNLSWDEQKDRRSRDKHR